MYVLQENLLSLGFERYLVVVGDQVVQDNNCTQSHVVP
jgi:hypothetical protein